MWWAERSVYESAPNGRKVVYAVEMVCLLSAAAECRVEWGSSRPWRGITWPNFPFTQVNPGLGHRSCWWHLGNLIQDCSCSLIHEMGGLGFGMLHNRSRQPRPIQLYKSIQLMYLAVLTTLNMSKLLPNWGMTFGEFYTGSGWFMQSTASLSHLRTMLPESSSRPLPCQAAQSRNLVLISLEIPVHFCSFTSLI